MYQLLLTRKYLTSKIMPLLASLAVTLCVAIVLTAWSVMGGFLNMLVNSGRTLVGDVVIAWPSAGFAYYDDLIERLEADSMIEAASPMIETYGLAVFPNDRKETVVIKGVSGPSFGRVTRYAESLYWKPLDKPGARDKLGEDERVAPLARARLERVLKNGLSLTREDPATGNPKPALVPGIAVSGLNRRDPAGFYVPRQLRHETPEGGVEYVSEFLPKTGFVTLNVLPLDAKGRAVDMVSERFPVANEFETGVWDVDSRTVLVHLEALQRVMKMNEAQRVADGKGTGVEVRIDPKTGKETFVQTAAPAGVDPARVTHVLVRGRGAMDTVQAADALRERCQAIYSSFAQDHAGKVPDSFDIALATWRDLNSTMINAVEKERGLVLFLFSFLSVTAVFLVLAIFWSMISEKTKDIGTLRALGASRAGIAGVWLTYGLAIGIVGALLGVGLAYLVVTNINPIHEWLGRRLGIVIWDPRIYLFTQIPNQIRAKDAAEFAVAGMLSSALGALWPAVRAAWMNPVRALRFE